MEIKQKWVKEVFNMETGGGCVVDFIKLQDGRILGINDESVVLYDNMEQFYEPLGNFEWKKRSIAIPNNVPKQHKPKLFLCHWDKPQYEAKWDVKHMEFFTEERGYDVSDLATIEGLDHETADSDTWEAEDHTVRRIQ